MDIRSKRATSRYLAIGVAGAVLAGGALALHPATAGTALAALNSVIFCNGRAPCVGGTNYGIGAGVKGVSINGNGVAGQTNFRSTSQPTGHAGIYGLDASRSGSFDSGVLGISTNGFGVTAISTNNNGIDGFSSCSICSGVYGESDNAGFGVAGRSARFAGIGVVGDGGPSGIGMQARVGTTNSGTPVIEGLNGSQIAVFDLDDAGNVRITGDLIPDRPARGIAKRVGTYASRASSPIVEDFGESTLRDGRASVKLDPMFARVIDDASLYVVFITPEGDNDGLYVTQRTLAGFEVREAHSGRSTLSFAYRILAHPYGETARRLPTVDSAARHYPVIHN